MSTNGSPLKTTKMAPQVGLLGSKQCPDDNVGVSDNNDGMHGVNTLNSGNRQINFILHQGIVTHPRSHHLQVMPCSTPIQHDIKLATKQWCIPRISELWAIVGSICFPSRRLWWTSNVPPIAMDWTWALISRCTSSGSSTAWKQASRSADIFLLDCSRTTFRLTWESPN
jgi:hypothetical protein